jgi:hypothetical protein
MDPDFILGDDKSRIYLKKTLQPSACLSAVGIPFHGLRNGAAVRITLANWHNKYSTCLRKEKDDPTGHGHTHTEVAIENEA